MELWRCGATVPTNFNSYRHLCILHNTKQTFLHVYLFLQIKPAPTKNWPRVDVFLTSRTEDNQYTRVQFWREKTALTRTFKVGDFIKVYAVLTANYRGDYYINSLDDTEVKVSLYAYILATTVN